MSLCNPTSIRVGDYGGRDGFEWTFLVERQQAAQHPIVTQVRCPAVGGGDCFIQDAVRIDQPGEAE